VGLLDAPDPAKPRLNTDGKWRVSELVRVNHLANCLLCHAPASKKDGVMHGVVPIRGRSLADVYCFDRNQKLVRADITYIKQDFSVSHDMSEKTRWPRMQRFDYMLRTRELCQTEIAQLCDNACCDVADSTDYPQRRAVLWALRELTGQDMGDRSESWRRYLEQTYASPVP
jgi:hypothetical protein